MLTFLNRQSSAGSTAAQPAVDPSGKFVVVANYNGANFVVLPINPDGSLEPVVSSIEQTGSGPNAERQDMSHPHAVVFDPGASTSPPRTWAPTRSSFSTWIRRQEPWNG